MNVSILLVIDRSPVDFVLQIDVIYPSMKVALFTSRHVKIRKNHSANVLFLKPWCLLISAQAVFTASVCIVNLCQLCLCTCSFLFVAVYENRLETSSGCTRRAICYAWDEFLCPKVPCDTGQNQWGFHLKAFNLNMYKKARKIMYFHRNCIFLVCLDCSTHQEFIVAKFGVFLVGFSGDLASVWHWPTMEELEGLILKIYMSLEEVGKKTIYLDQTYFSLRLVVHWHSNVDFYNVYLAKFLSLFPSPI